eukprot:TRINITY_DN27778_c0_g1_i1.p1 TRINITY_DN27778_c0_g1~~TRINITY_DN27778_c0_g1_i1.p1  ORF type:complete len:1139 (+),score=154.51 TRINITY_DN27778_c0_g1_i1:59-3475(+)
MPRFVHTNWLSVFSDNRGAQPNFDGFRGFEPENRQESPPPEPAEPYIPRLVARVRGKRSAPPVRQLPPNVPPRTATHFAELAVSQRNTSPAVMSDAFTFLGPNARGSPFAAPPPRSPVDRFRSVAGSPLPANSPTTHHQPSPVPAAAPTHLAVPRAAPNTQQSNSVSGPSGTLAYPEAHARSRSPSPAARATPDYMTTIERVAVASRSNSPLPARAISPPQNSVGERATTGQSVGTDLVDALAHALYLAESRPGAYSPFSVNELQLLGRLNTMMTGQATYLPPSHWPTVAELEKPATRTLGAQTNSLPGDVLVRMAIELASPIDCPDFSRRAIAEAAKLVAAEGTVMAAKVEAPVSPLLDSRGSFSGSVNLSDGFERADLDLPTDASAFHSPIAFNGELQGYARMVRHRDSEGSSAQESEVYTALTALAGAAMHINKLNRSLAFHKKKSATILKLANQLLSDELDDADHLARTVMEQARQLTSADRCSLFFVDQEAQELEAHFGGGQTIRMRIDAGIAGTVATTGIKLNIVDAYADYRFNPSIDRETGYHTDSILCMPVKCEQKVIAVAQLVNKKGDPGHFTAEDEHLFETFSSFAGLALRNCRTYNAMMHQKRKNEVMSQALGQLSAADVRKTDGVIATVAEGAKALLQAEEVLIYLVHKDINSLAAPFAAGRGNFAVKGSRAATAVAELAAEVMRTAQLCNTQATDQAQQEVLGGARSVLTVPVLHEKQVVAVSQAINKSGRAHFDKEDESSLETFSMFAGITLGNARLYEFVVHANQEAMQLFGRTKFPAAVSTSFHGDSAGGEREQPQSGQASLQYYKQLIIPPHAVDTIRTINFNIHEYRSQPELTVPLLVRIFHESGLVAAVGIPEDKIFRFISRTKEKYRHVPYHNFFHAFDVTHTVFLFLQARSVSELLPTFEKYVLLVTAVLHDIDHMGLNNSFHLKADTPLGLLSAASGSQSVLEVHHCALAVELLSDSGCDMFGVFDDAKRTEAFRILIDLIMATDMARHGDFLKEWAKLSQSGIDMENPQHRLLAMQMILKSADLSNVVKPFEISRSWAIAVTEEFYSQGDVEKSRGLQIAPQFDRTKTELPKAQLGFIAGVAKGHFAALAAVFPELQWCVTALSENAQRWAGETS